MPGVRSGITIAFQDEDIVDVGSVALDEITSDSATTVKVTLGDDAGDDFKVDTTSLVVEGDTGNVGIGTATPAKNLHVYGASGEVELRIQSDLSYSSIVHKDSGNELIIQNAATDGVTIFHDDTAERMRIDKDGNVGIGTNAPADKFHVVGDAALVGDVGVGIANPAKNLHVYGASGEVELRIQSDTSFCSIVQKDNNEMIIQNAASGGVMIFHDDSAERMRIDTDGNVGIGTNNPACTLHVDGAFAANISGTYGTFSSSDTTPSVAAGNLWKTHASAQTLTTFDGGVAGQTIMVTSTAAVVFDVTGTTLKGGSADITTASGDVTQWTHDGTNWNLQAFMDVSADMSSVGGGGGLTVTGVATDASPVTGAVDTVYIVNTSGGNVEIDLPEASGNSGKTIDVLHKTTGNDCIIDPDEGEKINGSTASITMTGVAFQNVTLICDGTEWYIR